MEPVTSGITVIKNIHKNWDYMIPFLLIILAIIYTYFRYFKIQKNKTFIYIEAKKINLDGIAIGVITTYIVFLIGSLIKIPEIPLGIASLVLMPITARFFYKKKSDIQSTTKILILLILLNIKIISNGANLFIIIFINLSAILLIIKGRDGFLFTFTSLLLFKKIEFGEYIANDLFHSAEFNISYQRGINSIGEWVVFPNIGYLEELLPNLLIDSLTYLSNGNIRLSIMDSYNLITIYLIGSIYYILQKKWPGFAYALTILLAIDRITLLLAMNIGLIITSMKKYNNAAIIIGALPIIFLGLSPIYSAIIIFSISLYIIKSNPGLKFYIIILVLAILQVTLINETFIYYLNVYKDWGSVNSAGHGTPMSDSKIFKIILRYVFFFLLSITIFQIFAERKYNKNLIIGAIGLIFFYYIYINYSFTRIESSIGTRIYPIGLVVLGLLIQSMDRHTKLIKIILIISFFGAPFSNPSNTKEFNLMRSSQKMIIGEKSIVILNKYLEVTKQFNEVIIFNNYPEIVNHIPNAKIPPFSSPWVAIGQLPQEKVIEFLDKFSTLPILMGENFETHDGVDIRARSPLIYKYIAENYNQQIINGIIVAIPIFGMKKNEFFEGFHIGSAPQYYNNTLKKSIQITILCKPGGLEKILTLITNEFNHFYADLQCGLNYVPQIYFFGKNISVDKYEY